MSVDKVWWKTGHINKIWNDEYKNLNYTLVKYSNVQSSIRWVKEGYELSDGNCTIGMCGFDEKHPHWTPKILEWLEKYFGWKDIGINYFTMGTGQVISTHRDEFETYREKFNIKKRSDVERVVIFMEDWKSGHYFEIDNKPFVDWKAGDWVWWKGTVPHSASNIGVETRYTLQLTGHR